MEGYARKKLVDRAHNEGMRIETHWQDNDSSTSLVLKEKFPVIKLMLCGGQAGRSHLNTLKTHSGWRPAASDRLIQLHIKNICRL